MSQAVHCEPLSKHGQRPREFAKSTAYEGLADHRICEYPTNLQPLARDLTLTCIAPNANGEITLPDAPGLGVEINPQALLRYRVDVEIRVNGRTLFSTPRA